MVEGDGAGLGDRITKGAPAYHQRIAFCFMRWRGEQRRPSSLLIKLRFVTISGGKQRTALMAMK